MEILLANARRNVDILSIPCGTLFSLEGIAVSGTASLSQQRCLLRHPQDAVTQQGEFEQSGKCLLRLKGGMGVRIKPKGSNKVSN